MKYTREVQIGHTGGQGEVWRARAHDGRVVALKYVKLPVAIQEIGTELERFAREVRCQRELDHPHIVKILGSKLKTDKPFLVMPLASGSLRDLLLLHPGGMPEEEACRIIMPILDAMSYAHREGVLHRDLKPENVLMFVDEPRISDFGLGRRLQSGSATITIANVGLGTLQYSAPEQLLDGHSGDERSDVYSLGRIFYEMLSGRVPFPRMDLSKVPGKFRHVIFTATSDDPSDRYQTVSAMIHDLKIVINGYETLRSPVDRAKSLLDALEVSNSGADKRALSRLLIEHGDDSELFDEIVARTTVELMGSLAEVSPDGFEQIALAMDRHAAGNFSWDWVDHVANALVVVFWATESTSIRTMMLKRLMLLGKAHNRFYVADVFSALVSEAISEQTYVQIVARLLRAHPECKEYLRKALLKRSLPALITEELAA